MDSTLRSNISVGLPLDLLLYETDSLALNRFVTIDDKNQYFQMIRNTWGDQLRRVFDSIDNPIWNASPEATANVLSSLKHRSMPVCLPVPPHLATGEHPELQTLAQDQRHRKS
jgi:putative proteasome-type protease